MLLCLCSASTTRAAAFLRQVGWSRENLVRKLRENPNGVTLVLKRLPGSARRRVSVSVRRPSSTQVQHLTTYRLQTSSGADISRKSKVCTRPIHSAVKIT